MNTFRIDNPWTKRLKTAAILACFLLGIGCCGDLLFTQQALAEQQGKEKESDLGRLEIAQDFVKVCVGRKVVANAKRGEIYPVLEVRGDWLLIEAKTPSGVKRGYVKKTEVRRIPTVKAGPAPKDPVVAKLASKKEKIFSLAGHLLTSTTPVKGTLDLKANTFIVEATVPLLHSEEASSLCLLKAHEDTVGGISDAIVSVAEDAHIERKGNQLTITFDPETFSDYMTFRTRSLWIKEERTAEPDQDPQAGFDTDVSEKNVHYHRLDFEPLTLAEKIKVQTYRSLRGEIFLAIPVKGLLPGFVVEYARDEGARENGVKNRDLAFIPVSKNRKQKNPVCFCDVYQLKRTEESFVRLVLQRFKGPDETRRYFFRVRHPNGALSNVVEVTRNGNQFPEMARRVTNGTPAQTDATVVMPNLELLTVKKAADACRELQQGLVLVDSAGRRYKESDVKNRVVLRQGIPKGKRILRNGTVVLLVESEMGTRSPRPAESPAIPGIDVEDRFGLVAIAPCCPVLGSPAADDGFLPSPFLNPPMPREDGKPPITTMAVCNDIGVDIHPLREAEKATQAATLKTILHSLVSQPKLKNLPGELGRTISQAIDDTEVSLKKAVRTGNAKQFPIGRVLEIVARNLDVSLTEEERVQIIQEWQQSHRSGSSLKRLDQNGNGKIADDIAIWVIEWIFAQSMYDPLRDAVVMTGSSGDAIAVLGLRFHEQDGVEIGKTLAKDDYPSEKRQPFPIHAPAVLASDDGPDQVRVPKVQRQSISFAKKEFDAVGLRIADPGKYYTSDQVQDVSPSENTWVKPKTIMDMLVHRKVPHTEKVSYGHARNELARFGFKTDRLVTPRNAVAVVVGQTPAAGAYARIGSTVKLESKFVVPDVADKSQRRAQSTLKSHGLGYAWDGEPFAGDIVFSQNPTAGHLLEPNAKVRLVRSVYMPKLVDEIEGKAIEKLKARGLSVARMQTIRSFVEVTNRTRVGKMVIVKQNIGPNALLLRSNLPRIILTRARCIWKQVEVPSLGKRPVSVSDAFKILKDWQFHPKVSYNGKTYGKAAWRILVAGDRMKGRTKKHLSEAKTQDSLLQYKPGTKIPYESGITFEIFIPDLPK